MALFTSFTSRNVNNGIQYLHWFPNGYGVSIVQHRYSYGYSNNLWELAVLLGTEQAWDLCYTTSITSDVIGYATAEEIDTLVERVRNLPAANL